LARVEWDLREPDLQVVDLGAAAREAIYRMEPLAESAGVELSLAGHGTRVRADAEWLEQALVVVVNNAMKYSGRGDQVRLRLEGGSVAVEDEGAGISAEDLPHVFGRFYQGKDSSGGFGLGLPICKELVERTGAKSPSTPKKGSERRSRSTCRRSRMAKVFVVEDDPAVRDVVEHALVREGMEVKALGDGEAALEHLRGAEPFDLVILDVMLPGMDGISLCRELRAGSVGPALTDVPVIMLTARDDETSVVVGLEVGADDYVTKPFRPRELVSRVRAHLRRQHLAARNATAETRKLEFPGLEVDLFRRQVLSGGSPVELTAKEFEVLALLASHPGRVYSREQIMRHLWDGDFFGEPRAADVHVQHIRGKIEPDPKSPRYVQTVRGMGYRFAEI